MKFTVLIENSGAEPLQCEHGLSILIEYRGERFLLDAGTTDVFLENAKAMNAPVWDVRTCFLSHGHYDHSGGFGTYLEKNKEAVLYMMQGATEDYYSASGEMHQIGIPTEVIEKHKERFQFVAGVKQIQEGIYLVPHQTEDLAKIGERAKLYRKVEDEFVSDDFSHEMSVVFDTKKGLVIFNSCSHGGAKNIIQEVSEALPEKDIYAFIGGLHMKAKKDGKEISAFSEEEIRELSKELEQLGLQILYTGHCTGKPAMEFLKKYMGKRVKELYTGLTVEI